MRGNIEIAAFAESAWLELNYRKPEAAISKPNTGSPFAPKAERR
jgi:hypothetical protein